MSSIIAGFLLTLMFATAIQAQRISDAAAAGLVGKVKEVRDSLDGITKFNEKGDITEIIYPEYSGCSRKSYTYHEDGSRTLVQWCYPGRATNSGEPRGPVRSSYKETYKYDSLGRVTEQLKCTVEEAAPSSGCEQIEYTYSIRGVVSEVSIRNTMRGNNSVLRRAFFHDSLGRVRVITDITSDVITTVFSYGADRFPLEVSTFYREGYTVEVRTTYLNRKLDPFVQELR